MIIPAGYAQCNWSFIGGSTPNGAEVTLGLDISGSLLDGPALAAELLDAYGDTLQDQMTTNSFLRGVSLKFGPNATGPTYEASGSRGGASGGNAVSPNTSVLVHKVTNTGGRQGRGRMFLPGFREDGVDSGGAIDSLYLSNMQIAANGLMTRILAQDVFPVLLRAAGSPIQTPEPLIGLVVDGTVATQRRRLRR